MVDADDALVREATVSLAGAESEFAAGRYDNAANRGYYACYQAAVAALRRAGVPPLGGGSQWSYAAVQAQFVGRLINRRKAYPGELRDVLPFTFALRRTADYEERSLTRAQAAQGLRQARRFVALVPSSGDRS